MPVTTTNSHPGNDYYVNALTGAIQRQSNPAAALLLHTAGYLGPYSWADAKGISAGIKATGATHPSGAGPIPSNQVLADSANPLSGLFQANIWIRVAEVGIADPVDPTDGLEAEIVPVIGRGLVDETP